MKYDFTTIINRQGKDAMAVDAPGKFPSFPLPEDGLILFLCGSRI